MLLAAGVSYAGATEKEDLVRLLTKAQAQASARASAFQASSTWQPVPEGVPLPPGLEVKFDMTKQKKYARLPKDAKPRAKSSAPATKNLHALLVS